MNSGYWEITWKFAGELDEQAVTERVYLPEDTQPWEWAETNSGRTADLVRVVVHARPVPEAHVTGQLRTR